MNKKFTMMLAAFVAAGYSVTVEAGVVKVTKAADLKEANYVISPANPLANGSYVLAEKSSGNSLSGVQVTTDLDANYWLLTNNTTDESGYSLKYVKGSIETNVNDYLEYNSTWKFTDTATEPTIPLKITDHADGNGALIVKSGETKLSISGETVGTDDTKLYFYEVAENVADVTSHSVKIGSKYLVVVTESGENKLALYSEAEYLQMAVPTTWTASSGVLQVASTVGTGAKVKLDESGDTKKLVLDSSTGTALQLVGESLLTVEGTDGYNDYIASDLTVTEDASKAVAYVTAALTDVRPADLGATVYVIADVLDLDDIKSDFRLAMYEGITTNNNHSFAVSKSGVTSTEASSNYANATDKTIYYWSIDKDGYFVNANGSKLSTSKLTVIPAISNGNKINAFYLRAANGKYIGADFALVDAASAKVFSALEAVQTEITALQLNAQVLGAYTSAFEYDETAATSNPFENVTAIDVTAGGKYVKGTYFVKNAPADVKLDEAYDATDADDLKKLNAMTFVAVDPTNSYDSYIKTTVGAGAKFVEVSGANLIENTQLTGKAGKVTTSNAAFTIKKNDSRPNEMYYELGTIYVDNSSNLQASTDPLYVAAVKLGADVVVTTTTVADNIPNNKYTSKSSANAVEYADFLKETARVFNIQFLSTTGATEEGDKEKSLYKKYLTVGEYSATEAKLLAQGAEFVDLSLPQNQWVVSNMTENNVITFTNRESGQSFTTTLVKTDKANEYSLFGTENANKLYYLYKGSNDDLTIGGTAVTLDNNTIVKLTEVSVSKNDGYESKAYEGYTKIYFSPVEGKLLDDLYVVVTETAATNNSTNETVSLNKAKATQFEVVRNVETEKAHVTNIAILKDGKPAVAENVKDTLEVVTYSFKQVRNDDLVKYLNDNMTQAVYVDTETASPAKFIIKKLNNGQVALVPFTDYAANNTLKADAKAFQLKSGNTGVEATYSVYEANDEPNAYITLKGEVLNTSFESAPQHVLFQSAGKYMAVGENNAAIMEAPSALKAEYSKADLTFWLDTTDSEELVPTFYISKGSKEFMFNAADSLSRFNEGTASYEEVEAYQMPDDENAPRAIFRSGSLKDSDTFVTKIEDDQKELTAGKGIESYQYKIVLKDNAVSDEYVVRSAKNLDYLYEVNGALGFTDDAKKAIVFNIESTEAPTSNEGVSVSDVKVVAQNGSVVVMNAAGKNVVVSTILGQVVVNEVLTSDNATISVPAGIVVVAVDGESFKVNVK